MLKSAFNHDARVASFPLPDTASYQAWREQKLSAYPARVEDLIVEIKDPYALSLTERAQLLRRFNTVNMAIYSSPHAMDKQGLRALCAQFHLHRLDKNPCADDDGISLLRVVPDGKERDYIPYSNRPMNWHTDGYYNGPDRTIRAMVLHCAQPAAHGGMNALLDHEIVYLLLRDINPDFIAALMHPHCMTIPANENPGTEVRLAQSGPVFSIDATTQALHMRYTARTRSIEWRDDKTTRAAVQALEHLLNSNLPYVFRIRLARGQGVICNNVLHARTGFENNAVAGQERLVYRARFYDRIAIN